MSVKVYNGLISYTPDVFETMRNIRSVLEPLFLTTYANIYADYSSLPPDSKWGDLDYFLFDDEPHPNGSSRRAFELYDRMEKLNVSATHTFSEADIFYTVTIIPSGVPGGNPLVLIFSEQSTYYTEALRKSGVVLDFAYWDNSDSPDELDEEAWAHRKKAWSVIFDDAPSKVGLSFSNPSKVDAYLSLRKNKQNADK